jgi:hypothetical protein
MSKPVAAVAAVAIIAALITASLRFNTGAAMLAAGEGYAIPFSDTQEAPSNVERAFAQK